MPKGKKKKEAAPKQTEAAPELKQGKCALYLGDKELQRFGLKSGDGLLDVWEDRLVSQQSILEEVDFMGKMSPFARVLLHVQNASTVEHNSQPMLLFHWDPDESLQPECNFWFCVSPDSLAENQQVIDSCLASSGEDNRQSKEEAEAEAQRIAEEKAAAEEAQAIADAIAKLKKPICIREWNDLGSLSEMKQSHSRIAEGLGVKGESQVWSAVDECAPVCPFPDSEPGSHLDCSVQAGQPPRDERCQTTVKESMDRLVQCDGAFLGDVQAKSKQSESETVEFDESALSEFLQKSVPMMENVISDNQIIDCSADDLTILDCNNESSQRQSSQLDSVKVVQTFVDLEWSRGKRLTNVEWSPDKGKHMAAVSCASKIGFEERVGMMNTSRVSTILLWNLNDVLLRAQVVLSAPAEIFTFKFHPHKSTLIIAGLDTGQIALWRLPRSYAGLSAATPIEPYMVSVIEKSHTRGVTDLLWLPQSVNIDEHKKDISLVDLANRPSKSKLDSEERFFSVAPDGQIILWGIVPSQLNEKEQRKSGGDKLKWLPLSSIPTRSSNADSEGGLVLANQLRWSPVIGQIAVSSELGRMGLISLGQLRESFVKAKGHRIWAQLESTLNNEECVKLGESLLKADGRFRNTHPMSVRSLQMSPHFADIALSVAGWSFSISRLGTVNEEESLLFQSPLAPCMLTCAVWSPTRPGVLLTSKIDGTLDVWDLIEQSHSPVFANVPISSVSITKLSFSLGSNATDQQLAVADEMGNLRILQIPRSLSQPIREEGTLMGNFYLREVIRNKFVRKRQEGTGAANGDAQESEEEDHKEEPIAHEPSEPEMEEDEDSAVELEEIFQTNLTALLKSVEK